MTQMNGATGSPVKIRDKALPITPPQPQMKSTQTVIDANVLKIGGIVVIHPSSIRLYQLIYENEGIIHLSLQNRPM